MNVDVDVFVVLLVVDVDDAVDGNIVLVVTIPEELLEVVWVLEIELVTEGALVRVDCVEVRVVVDTVFGVLLLDDVVDVDDVVVIVELDNVDVDVATVDVLVFVELLLEVI